MAANWRRIIHNKEIWAMWKAAMDFYRKKRRSSFTPASELNIVEIYNSRIICSDFYGNAPNDLLNKMGNGVCFPLTEKKSQERRVFCPLYNAHIFPGSLSLSLKQSSY